MSKSLDVIRQLLAKSVGKADLVAPCEQQEQLDDGRDDADRAMAVEMAEFDWASSSLLPSKQYTKESPYLMFLAPANEQPYDRRLRMLQQVKKACMACTMCELGRSGVTRDDKLYRDPHVFSSMNPTRFMVVGQNPGWNEVCQGQPFVGDAGMNFNRELEANGLTRDDFYICNTVRCHTNGNAKPSAKHAQRCRPFLDIEINLIRPLLIATLGAVAFEALCPHALFRDSLGSIVESEQYEVPVFPLYHPSPLNLESKIIEIAFKAQMKLLCGVVRELKRREDDRAAKSSA